jgi:hypothetical protein
MPYQCLRATVISSTGFTGFEAHADKVRTAVRAMRNAVPRILKV